jgi:hypothetical protein
MQNYADDSQIFLPELASDEKVLWSGRPRLGKILYPVDLLRIVICLALVSPFVYVPIKMESYDFLWFTIPSMGVVIILAGFSGIIKRFQTTCYTRYAITDHRVMIANIRRSGSIKSVPLQDIKGLTIKTEEDRSGTIILGDVEADLIPELRYSGESVAYRMPGLNYLYEIPEVEQAHDLLSRLIGEKVEETASLEEAIKSLKAIDEDGIGQLSTYYAPSPRSIRPTLVLIALTGNVIFQFAILWLGLTLVFARIMLAGFNFFPLASRIWEPRQTTAVVTDLNVEGFVSDETGQGVALKKYTYRFTDRAGKEQQSVYHSSGGPYEVGKEVNIEYIPDHPNLSRIVGLAPAASTFEIVIMGIFGGFGILILSGGLWYSRRSLFLMRNGEVAIGKLTAKVLSRSEDSRDYRNRVYYYYAVTYAFRARDGNSYKVFSRISAGLVHVKNPEAETDVVVPDSSYILYDPHTPAKALLARDLPGHPKFDRPGLVYSGEPMAVVKYLVLPVIVVGGHLFGPYLWNLLIQASI